MPRTAVDYAFRQRFSFPAAEVYRWATTYEPGDMGLLGLNGRRKIEVLCENGVLLTDTFRKDDGGRVVKKKLVRLYPERLAYTNTHVAGPNLYSQYLYEIVPEGKHACRLVFTGRELVDLPTADRRAIAAHARRIRSEDAAVWKRLAAALVREKKARRGGGT